MLVLVIKFRFSKLVIILGNNFIVIIYFPPPQIYLWMGEENHNLLRFFQILPNLHRDDLHPLDYRTCIQSNLRFIQEEAKIQKYCAIFKFTKEEAENRKNALPFVQARYNLTFDVISEVNCVLSRRQIFDWASIVSQLKVENIPVYSGRLVFFSRRFMNWNATIIVTCFSIHTNWPK